MSGRYALMWSGGKDCALALHRARLAGLDIARLVTFYDAATRRVRFHAVRIDMIRAQAAAAGIAIDAIATSWPEMEARLAVELAALKAEGFAGVVFGDIHLADVRAWYEERVTAAGLEHVEPIWGEPPRRLLEEFVDGGGRAVVTCVDTERLDESWLGRLIDASFVRDIASAGVDACGENGEYHSYVFAGPALGRDLPWHAGATRSDGRFLQVDVLPDNPDAGFRADVELSRLVDPRPTLENLARATGLTYEDVVHHALARYASSGAEALLSIDPHALRRLIEARKAEDWESVAGIVDWLEAGLAEADEALP